MTAPPKPATPAPQARAPQARAPEAREPHGALALKVLAMPADTNPNGDIFGGWVLGQMDIAGGIVAVERARGRVATVAVDAMKFHLPIRVGDVVCCYAGILRVGRTSLPTRVETWVVRRDTGASELVTEGTFTYVAIDAEGRPRPLPVE